MRRPASGYVSNDHLVLDSGPLEDAPGYATPLARIVEKHLPAFEDRVRTDSGTSLPRFVLRELRALTHCADPCRGFHRLRCDRCRADRVVPFTCHARLCAACSSRRMSDTAAYLVDRVLRPDLPWRQWVFTWPPTLAVGLCFHADLAAAVRRVALRTLFDFQRARAVPGPGRPRSAAVVFIQRFSDGLGAWHHLHVLSPDGVFREHTHSLEVPFEPQPPPTGKEVTTLVRRVAKRVTALVRRRAALKPDHPVLVRCAQQPATPARRPTPPPSRPRRPDPLCASHDDFTVHAATSVAPDHTADLERLCRYLARPPLAADRLQELPDGRIAIALKRPRRGITRFVFEPLAFLARLAALIPQPYTNQVVYHGAIASGSPLRSRVIPAPPESTPHRPTAPPRPRRMKRADLIQRVFHQDDLACSCGGRLRTIAVISDPTIAQTVAAAIILSNQAEPRPPPRRTRAT